MDGLQSSADAVKNDQDTLLGHEGAFLSQSFHFLPEGPSLEKNPRHVCNWNAMQSSPNLLSEEKDLPLDIKRLWPNLA